MAEEVIEARFDRGIDQWRSLSWSSIIFGALVALAISFMLHALSFAIAADSVDPGARLGDVLSWPARWGGILFLVAVAIGLFVGGFVASTLAHTFSARRAAAYGLGVWSIATLASLAFFLPLILGGTSAAIATAGNGAGVANAAANLGFATNKPLAGLREQVLNTLIATTGAQSDPNAVRQVAALIDERVPQGDWTARQRTQLDDAVARAANIPVEDARRRVTAAEGSINAAVVKARQDARDDANDMRLAVAGLGYWTFLAMIVGLIASYLGARFGERNESELPSFARVRFVRPTDEGIPR